MLSASSREKLFLLQQSQNVLRPSSLELATSLLGASRLRREKLLAFRELFGAKALYLLFNTISDGFTSLPK